MSICASGASTTQAGVPASVVVDRAYVQSLLPAVLAWVYPYLPFMHGLEIGNVGAFCSADPPTYSFPTATQLFNFVTGGPLTDVQIVEQFLEDLTRSYLWFKLCQCTSGATPAPVTPPAPPANLPAVNPQPYVSLPLPTPCLSRISPVPQLVDSTHSEVVASLLFNGLRPTSLRITVTKTVVTAPGATSSHTSTQIRLNPSSSTVRSDVITAGPSGTFTLVVDIDPTAEFYQIDNSYVSGAGGSNTVINLEFFCGGNAPNSPNLACCPPDPIMLGTLAQILQTVTLIQRQNVPFAYLVGATHSVSGNGQFAVTGLLGLAVSLTSTPPNVGAEAGDPVELFGAGWLNVGTADGWVHLERITTSPFLYLPNDMGSMTLVGYSLPPGETATISELVREP